MTKLDQTDFGLIESLQRDARISNKDLAAENNISPSTCLERVRRLRQSGVVRGFHADIAPEALGIGVQAMISVRLGQHAKISFQELLDELIQIPEVINVYLLAGSQDFLVHVAVRDVPHLRDVTQHFTLRRDASHVETSLVFDFARSSSLPNYARAQASPEGDAS